MNLGQNIKILRMSKRISQKDLAKKLGITHNYLSMIENESKKPSLGLLEKLARALGVPMVTLFSEFSFGSNS